MAKVRRNRLYENFLRVAQQYLAGRGFRAQQTASDLRKRLDIPEQHEDIFSEVLAYLVQSGELRCQAGRYSLSKGELSEVVPGILRLHPRGFGFVQPDDKARYPQDIFIPKHLTQNAIDGDKVEVVLSTEPVSEKGPEGRISAVVERARTHIAGVISVCEGRGDTLAYCPLLGVDRRIVAEAPPDLTVRVGDRVVMRVIDWGDHGAETRCEISHLIGHISDASCDIEAAVEAFDLRDSFPHSARKEARRFGRQVPLAEIHKREDLRKTVCVTVDPDTAKDFDDAISLKRDRQGNYHLGVHIADVSHYVRPGSALDVEAQERCNSTYFPGRCVPMLPPELSENLCSLRPDVNRLTASVFMTFDKEGTLVDYRIARTVIRSHKRFTYGEAKQVLDGKRQSRHAPLLKCMVELCRLLKNKRYERGSIEFALTDLVVIVDDSGIPQGTKAVEYDVTHQMIEEFMLKANEVVAWHLTKEGKGLTYRIHEEPAEENLREFAITAAAFGFRISDCPDAAELQDLFNQAMETPYGPFLATSYIRSMRMAIYSPDNIGHYGLGLEHYCHFTSPIRRYVDLAVHRTLFDDEIGRDALEAVSNRCSEQERLSAKAENNVILLKKLRLLDANKKESPFREYQAVVTRVKQFGFSFEVLDVMLEGFIHVSRLSSDYFIFDEKRRRLCGRETNLTYSAGDKISVVLCSVDLIMLESSWDLVEEPSTSTSRPRTGPGRRSSSKRPRKTEAKSGKPKPEKKRRRKKR